MTSISLLSTNTSPLNTKKTIKSPISFPPHLLSTSQYITFNKRDFPLPISANSSISYPQPPFSNVDYMEREFGSHGVSFTELGESYVIKMVLENGSIASVLMPSGLITSYKPKMWHGSSVEVLHTCVSERKDGDSPIIQGGVYLGLNCVGDNEFSWSPTSWVLSDVKGNSQDSIQVEILSRDLGKMVEVKHNITLKYNTLISEVTVSNLKSTQIELTGSILSHLTVSTPDATYAYGLERSNFINKQPLISDFCIIPPNLPNVKESNPGQSWPLSSIMDLFSEKKDVEGKLDETVGEEDENYKQLSDELSRIYTDAPRNFTIIDRGKRNSVMVGRNGFDELYVYSPGSSYEWYSKYAYICVGQSAVLRPIRLGPQQSWRGEQRLHNPNL